MGRERGGGVGVGKTETSTLLLHLSDLEVQGILLR